MSYSIYRDALNRADAALKEARALLDPVNGPRVSDDYLRAIALAALAQAEIARGEFPSEELEAAA